MIMRDNIAEEKTHRQTEMRKSQATLFSLQSDRKRLEHKQSDAQAEIRRIRSEISHLKASLEDREIALQSFTREVNLMDEEITRVEKYMNSL